MTQAASIPSSREIVARADFQYRWRVYAMFLLLFGYGLWSMYDGFINWPRDNAAWQQMIDHGRRPPRALHTSMDIFLNQALGVGLPTIGLALFAWMMYRSRGAYRFDGQTLQVPGHPPLKLDQVRSIDMTRWDRKGVAVVEYQAGDGTAKTFSLRDMIYQREATDQIVHAIEKHLSPDGGGEAAESAEPH